MPAPIEIVIDPAPSDSAVPGVRYPCKSWRKAEQGKPLSVAWDKGLRAGMAQSVYDPSDPNRSLAGAALDVSSPPYVRIQPGVTEITMGSALDTSFPCYTIRAQQPNGTNVLYILNSTKRFKINRDTNAIIEVIDTASVIYGRPALFEGSWRLARGTAVACGTLVIGNGAGTDSVTALGTVKARHFAVIQDGSTAKIAKADNDAGTAGNVVMLSSDFVTFAGAFEAGDTSFSITDLLEWQGELLVIKGDGPRRFSVAGDSVPLQRFFAANLNTATYEGSNSLAHGPYAYWVSSQGIARIFNDSIDMVGFEVAPSYFADSTDAIADTSVWNSIVAHGRWAYGARGSQVWQGYIENDGRITWLSEIFFSGATCRVGLDDGPAVYVIGDAGNNLVGRINLQPDGSTRNVLGSTRGGGSNPNGYMFYPKVNLGSPDRLKQLRREWAILEGMSNATYQARAERDGAAVQNVGSGITASGFTEAVPTPGTTDTAREWRLGFSLVLTGTSDSRVRAFGADFHTLDVYEAVIDLSPDAVRGFSGGIKGLLKKLQHLQNAQLVGVKIPAVNETFNGYILGVAEKVVGQEDDANTAYEVTVLIERPAAPA